MARVAFDSAAGNSGDGLQLRLFEPGDQQPGGELTADLTLSEFFACFIRPMWLVRRHSAAATLVDYERTIAYWREFTGDPPLTELDQRPLPREFDPAVAEPERSRAAKRRARLRVDRYLESFRAGMAKLPGRHGGASLTCWTEHNHLRKLETCLTLAGPPTGRHPKAADLIWQPPALEKPERDAEPRQQPFTMDELGRIMDACRTMTRPRKGSVSAPEFWRAIVIVAYNTGERRGALLAVRFSDLGQDLFGSPTITFRAVTRKGRKRSHTVPLNEAARMAIEAIRNGRESGDLIFPWPNCLRWFHASWLLLLGRAGVPKERWFGMHSVRKTAGTVAARRSPAAAQALLGHSDMRTTRQHYAMGPEFLDAMRDLPQPDWRPEKPR